MQWGWALSQRVNNVGKGEGKKKKHSGKQEQYEWNKEHRTELWHLSKILKFFLTLTWSMLWKNIPESINWNFITRLLLKESWNHFAVGIRELRCLAQRGEN